MAAVAHGDRNEVSPPVQSFNAWRFARVRPPSSTATPSPCGDTSGRRQTDPLAVQLHGDSPYGDLILLEGDKPIRPRVVKHLSDVAALRTAEAPAMTTLASDGDISAQEAVVALRRGGNSASGTPSGRRPPRLACLCR